MLATPPFISTGNASEGLPCRLFEFGVSNADAPNFPLEIMFYVGKSALLTALGNSAPGLRKRDREADLFTAQYITFLF